MLYEKDKFSLEALIKGEREKASLFDKAIGHLTKLSVLTGRYREGFRLWVWGAD